MSAKYRIRNVAYDYWVVEIKRFVWWNTYIGAYDRVGYDAVWFDSAQLAEDALRAKWVKEDEVCGWRKSRTKYFVRDNIDVYEDSYYVGPPL